MNAKSKSLFAKLLTIIMIFCCMLGAWFTLPFGEGKTANAATTIDITDTIGLKFESGYSNMTDGADYSAGYTGKDDICLVGYVGDSVLNANSKLSTGQCWVASASASNPTNNGGVNIMEYIYVNGSSISALSAANAAGTTSYKGTHWELGQGGKRAPALVETSSTSGLLIRICMAYSNAGKFEIVIKEGFQLLDVNGDTVTVSKDVAFTYENGAVTKADKTTPAESYTLSFESTEGEVDPITVTGGSAIGTLPAVPEKSGYTGVWMIDGVEITADTVYTYGANKTAVAVYTENAGKIDITDAIMFTQDDWMSGSPADCITLSIRIYNEQKTDWLYEYVVADSSIKGYWNDNGESFAPTNGVDIMDYLYFNGESARSIVTKNKNGTTSYTGTTFPLSLGGVYSPIAIETTGSFTKMMILNAWIPASGFTITVKSGFELLLSDGNILTTTDDVSFQYANGTIAKVQEYTLSFEGLDETKTVIAGSAIGALPAVPEKSGYKGVWTIDGAEITADTVYSYGADKTAVAVYTGNTEKENVDVTETVSIVGGSYSNAQSQVKIELDSSSALTSNGWWNIYGSKLATANNDVDIMDYIYINGQNIRTLSDDNRTNNTYPLGEATGWLGNSDQCRPVFVETTADGIYLTVLHAFSGASYTITLKAGFALLNADGNIYTINKDVEFLYTGDSMKKIQEYTLSFEGLDETKTVIVGQAIGALPAVPEQSGRTGVWTIDGVEITADTVYTYDSDKTAVVAYEKIVERVDVTETVSIVGGSYSNAQSQVKIELDSSSALTSNGWWNIYGSKLTTANNGVDIMDYIYINGQNIRTLSDDNRTNNTYPLGEATGWLGNSDQCRPVFVETTADGIYLTVLHAFSGANYTITLKAGFALLNADGNIYTISKDVNFGSKSGVVSKIDAYILSFEGLTETKTVFGGETIGELPALEEREGLIGEWKIDGVVITANTVYDYGTDKTAVAEYRVKLPTYVLSFDSSEGSVDSITVEENAKLINLPAVPKKALHTGVWTIDGEAITADTVYSYGEDKTAVAVYTAIDMVDVTGRLTIEDRDWAAAEDHTALGVLIDGAYLEVTEALRKYWNNNDATLAPLNNGCDIMEYIYINGQSARSLVAANKAGESSYEGTSFPFSSGGLYAPVVVETASKGNAGMWIKILNDFAGGSYTVTIKKGFTIITPAEEVLVVSGDITFEVTRETTEDGKVKCSISKDVQSYALSFECTEGAVDAIQICAGATLDTLPAVPAKVGYTGVWTIDGVKLNASKIYAYGENKTAVAVYEPIEYTITIVRASGEQEEICFNVENAASKLAEVTLTQSNEEYAYSWKEELPAALEAKNYTFIEVETDLIPDTRIIGQSISVGENFAMNVYVEVVDEHVPQMQFTMGETVVVAEGVLVNAKLNKYVYRMDNIAAYDLATECSIRLFIEEKEIDSMLYSIEAYLNALSKKEISDDLKTLIADIVVYGQAAEAYVGKKGGIQTIEGLSATQYTGLTETDYKKSAFLNDGIEITSVNVVCADVNSLAIRFTSTIEGTPTVKINGNVVAFTEVEAGSGVYEIKSKALYVAGCDDRFKVTISVDDNVVQTLIYSVESYVYEKQNSSNQTEAKYAKALYNCSLALKAYAEGV